MGCQFMREHCQMERERERKRAANRLNSLSDEGGMRPVIERVPPAGLPVSPLVSFRTLRPPEVILIRVDLSSRQEGRQKRMGLSYIRSDAEISPHNFTTWKFKLARWHFIFYGSDGSHETKDGGTPERQLARRPADRSALKPKSSIKIDCIRGSGERIDRER